MWPAIIGLAVSLFKTFATSAASAAGSTIGTRAGQAVFRHAGEAPAQAVIAAAQPQASQAQRASASQELLAALKTNEAFRDEVRAILAQDDPEALTAGEDVQHYLESAPAEVQEVVSGAKPVTDYVDPLYLWKLFDLPPMSAEQTRFLQSNSFNRVCPVGGENLGWDGARYLWQAFGTPQEIRLPTMLLPGPPNTVFAACKNGHRWPVFAA